MTEYNCQVEKLKIEKILCRSRYNIEPHHQQLIDNLIEQRVRKLEDYLYKLLEMLLTGESIMIFSELEHEGQKNKGARPPPYLF